MKSTHQLLNLDKQVYDNDTIERYMRWCENISNIKMVCVQSIMANTAISNYYRYQFLELEHEFKSSAKLIYGKVSDKIIRNMYTEIIVQLYNSYPSALIEEAKKLKIENPPYAN
ncbi:hypothetical protein [Flavobacterium sp.]